MLTLGETISVVVRLSRPPLPPGRKSVTEPSTLKASPTATVGEVRVKTKIPSLVARSASATGSCIQKPVLERAVTMPVTPLTGVPARGERWDAPWIAAMVSAGFGGGGAMVQVWGVVVELAGEGAPAAKSVAFWSVSTQASIRLTDVEFVVPGAGPLPSKNVAVLPYPTRSTMAPAASTTATRPAEADIVSVPMASGIGSAVAPVLAPSASFTR